MLGQDGLRSEPAGQRWHGESGEDHLPPEGSLINPRFPAPVNMYIRASQTVASPCCRVLGQLAPERIPAPASGGSMRHLAKSATPRMAFL